MVNERFMLYVWTRHSNKRKRVYVLCHRQQYVDAYLNYTFNESVKGQFQAFYEGFHKVCGGRVLVSGLQTIRQPSFYLKIVESSNEFIQNAYSFQMLYPSTKYALQVLIKPVAVSYHLSVVIPSLDDHSLVSAVTGAVPSEGTAGHDSGNWGLRLAGTGEGKSMCCHYTL